MNIIKSLENLIIQATTEHTHFYVKSVCEETIKHVLYLEKQIEIQKKIIEIMVNKND